MKHAPPGPVSWATAARAWAAWYLPTTLACSAFLAGLDWLLGTPDGAGRSLGPFVGAAVFISALGGPRVRPGVASWRSAALVAWVAVMLAASAADTLGRHHASGLEGVATAVGLSTLGCAAFVVATHLMPARPDNATPPTNDDAS